MLSRAAPTALFGGIAAAVVGLSKLHASQVGTYDYTGSSRFAWSLAYIAILAVAAYGMGLPDVPRTRRSAVISAVGAAALGALGMSVVQLAIGDALLPRFVVFGGAFLLVPWYLVCVNLATDGRTSEERRDRVVVVAERADAVAGELEHELAVGAEAGAVAVTRSASGRPCWSSTGWVRSARASWPRPPRSTPPASVSARFPSSTRSGWASCRSASWSGCR